MLKNYNRSGEYNCWCAVNQRSVSINRVLQMRSAEYEDVLFVLQMLGNKADEVPCECLQKI